MKLAHWNLEQTEITEDMVAHDMTIVADSEKPTTQPKQRVDKNKHEHKHKQDIQ